MSLADCRLPSAISAAKAIRIQPLICLTLSNGHPARCSTASTFAAPIFFAPRSIA